MIIVHPLREPLATDACRLRRMSAARQRHCDCACTHHWVACDERHHVYVDKISNTGLLMEFIYRDVGLHVRRRKAARFEA